MTNLPNDFNENAQAPSAMVVPTWIEENPKGRVAYDIFSRLLKERIIVLNGPVTDQTAHLITAQMLILDQTAGDITFYINSPGGSVTAGMAIFDTMKSLKNDVITVGLGQNCSMGSFLLAAGTKGKRFALPNTRIMTHQPSAGTQGKVSDMERHMEEFRSCKARMKAFYMHFTDMNSDDIEELLDRDKYFNALAGLELGHIDKIIMKSPTDDSDLSVEDKKLLDLERKMMQEEIKNDPMISRLIANRKQTIANDNDSAPEAPEASM